MNLINRINLASLSGADGFRNHLHLFECIIIFNAVIFAVSQGAEIHRWGGQTGFPRARGLWPLGQTESKQKMTETGATMLVLFCHYWGMLAHWFRPPHAQKACTNTANLWSHELVCTLSGHTN